MLDNYLTKINLPYLLGIYTAINAISDSCLLVDGPNCAFGKSQYIYGSHDHQSTLLDVNGIHRIVHTDLHPDKVITGHGNEVLELLKKISEEKAFNAIFLTSLPAAYITGVEYDSLINKIKDKSDKLFLNIPGRSLDKDWIDGYEDFLTLLAKKINLKNSVKKSKNAAIIGNFMDRNEGDHRGNLEEIGRLLKSFDLNLVSTWLDGGTGDNLKKVENSEIIISLPHGRKAAKIISQKTGALLVETCLPFGLDATNEFISTIGSRLNMEDLSERIINENLANIIKPLEWIIPKYFLHKNIIFAGDPDYFSGISQFASMLGMNIKAYIALKKNEDKHKYHWSSDLIESESVFWEPDIEKINKLINQDDVDLIISNTIFHSYFQSKKNISRMEFGFPSFNYHMISNTPFLGYRGASFFIDRMLSFMNEKNKRYSIF